jgi:glutamate racemase
MNTPRIGIFDSGVGGLTVLEAIANALPEEQLIYLGDTARVPYGTKGPDTIRRYALECALFLAEKGVKLIVVACNSASAVALPFLQATLRIPLIGVIQPAVALAAQQSTSGRIGVIATRATIATEAYAKQLYQQCTRIQVTSCACPLFVPLIEEGYQDKVFAQDIVAEHLAPFAAKEIDTLILGCTHFPLLRSTIQSYLGAGVQLIDSAEACAAQVKALMQNEPHSASERTGPTSYYVTDDPKAFARLAERFFGQPLENVQRCQLLS